MKSIQLIVIVLFTSLFSSCVRFVDAQTRQPLGQMGGGHYGQQQQGQTSLKPFYPGQKPSGRVQTGTKQVQTGNKETKKFIGGFTVQLWDSNDKDLKQKARVVTEEYFRENKVFPSDDYVSKEIGHKCRLTNKRAS